MNHHQAPAPTEIEIWRIRVWTAVACAASMRGVAQFATLTLRGNDVFVRSSGGGTYVKSRVSTSQAQSIVGDNSDRVRAHPHRSLDRPARVWIGEADRACDLDRRTVWIVVAMRR